MSIVHRIGRQPDPWEYPDWSRANPDGTFGNRFDDPNGEYRVLYASAVRLGCFLETLARYRPDVTLYAELQEIDGEDDFVPPGVVPHEWFRGRIMGSATANGRFADVGASDWLSILRRTLAPLLINLGMPDFDAAVLQRTAPRRLTQNVSAVVYREGFNGIRYLSKYGHDIENWALFEPADLTSRTEKPIQQDDPDLLEALHRFDLTIG
jgi:RES domain